MSELDEPIIDLLALGKKEGDGLMLKSVGLFESGHRCLLGAAWQGKSIGLFKQAKR
jgi:hypothetical protein